MPNEDNIDNGYAEYLAVNDTHSVIQIPNNIPSEVGAMLPGGALTAYAAVNTARPFVEKIQKVKRKFVLYIKILYYFLLLFFLSLYDTWFYPSDLELSIILNIANIILNMQP